MIVIVKKDIKDSVNKVGNFREGEVIFCRSKREYILFIRELNTEE